MDNSSRIIELANRYLVTNVVSKVEPVVIEEGRGAYLKDIDGKEYIDCAPRFKADPEPDC